MSEEFKDQCGVMRYAIEALKKTVHDDMMDCIIECGPESLSEAISNIKIAYRHIEDALMRFGKAIQAADGGVSIYDKDKPVAADEIADEDT